MQKYDKIYHPAEGKSQTDYYMDREGDLVGLTELSNRIVLTVEELKEVWDASREGYNPGWGGDYDSVEEYLKSQGINIE